MAHSARRGGALLAVLWLSAALASIAFAVATTVRTEAARASTLGEGIRAYYLAAGAVERAILEAQNKLGWAAETPRVRYEFPGGVAIVDIVPETARLSLNQGNVADFAALLLALGAEPGRAQEIAVAILDWRQPGGAFDAFYSTLVPSFAARHASFQEVEEALYVKGMTPELFHGNYTRDRAGRLVRLGAFKDCVSVYGTTGPFDANHAEPALLASLGIPRDAADQIVRVRQAASIRNPAQLAGLAGGATARLRVGGNSIYTFRATARARNGEGLAARLSEVSRTVSAQVKFRKYGEFPPHQILRWHDNAWSEVSQW